MRGMAGTTHFFARVGIPLFLVWKQTSAFCSPQKKGIDIRRESNSSLEAGAPCLRASVANPLSAPKRLRGQ